MRKNVKGLVAITDQYLPFREPVVEIGSYQVPGQEKLADLRPLLGEKAFIGCDMRAGPGVDRIEDVEGLTFSTGTVGSVIMIDTLEHVRDPRRALAEVYRVLEPDGVVVASSVMDFYIHDHPADYWRFTPEAFAYLFEPFDQVLVGWQGNPEKPHTVFVVAVKEPSVDHAAALREIQEAYRRSNGTPYWRMAQVYYALRDLAANLRGWNNRFGFELVARGTAGSAASLGQHSLPQIQTVGATLQVKSSGTPSPS